MHRLFSVDFIHSSTTNVIFLHELLIRCVHTYVMVWNVIYKIPTDTRVQGRCLDNEGANMSWD